MGDCPARAAAALCVLSQYVHTPRVIASHFVAGDARGFIQPIFGRRRPETLQVDAYMVQTFPVQSFMDEVDGRPGAVALQSGHLDAPRDVRTYPLSLPYSTLRSTVISSTQLPRLFTSPHRTKFVRRGPGSGADQPKAACPTAGGLHHRRWLAPPQVVGEHHENLPGK